MSETLDMRDTIIPKSDQLNADDLIGGPRTVRITKVSRANTAEQPIAVNFDGDGGKPYMPCKSMRRVMILVWGPAAESYTGRSMTLFRDPSVTWGGMEVGGIRISHMSHITEPVVMALTATKKARKPYRVLPLVEVAPPPVQQPQAPEEDRARVGAEALAARFAAVVTAQDYFVILDEPQTANRMQWLEKNRPELHAAVEAARAAAAARMEQAPNADKPGDDGWPGPDAKEAE